MSCPSPQSARAVPAATLSERLLANATLEARDRQTLLQTAQRLQRAARDGGAARLLSGRHVAIAIAAEAEAGATPARALFERAALQLGARVSRIAPGILGHGEHAARAATARLLPRLYDAIDCHLGSTGHALALHRGCGVPVYLALGGARHPIRALVDELAGIDGELALFRLVQAVLVETLG